MLTKRSRRREKERAILRSLVTRQNAEIQRLRQQVLTLQGIVDKQETMLWDDRYVPSQGDLADYMEEI